MTRAAPSAAAALRPVEGHPAPGRRHRVIVKTAFGGGRLRAVIAVDRVRAQRRT